MSPKSLLISTLLASTYMLIGCSSLEVAPVDTSTAPGVAKGINYSLPFATYRISVTRTYSGCEVKQGKIALSFDLDARAEQVLLPDPGNTYAIDIDSVSNWFKTSDLKWEVHPNNMLKSIGAKMTDHTGEVITNVAATAVKAAQLAATAGIGGARSTDGYTCKDMKDIKTAADNLEKEVNRTSAELTSETAKLDAMVKVLGSLAKDGTAHHHSEVFKQAVTVAEKTNASTKAQQAYQSQIKKLTVVQTFVWPESGNVFEGEIKADNVPLAARKAPAKFVQVSKDAAPISFDLGVSTISLSRLTSTSVTGAKTIAPSEAKGIRYRAPADGVLLLAVCPQLSPYEKGTLVKCPTEPNKLEIALKAVPQLGRVHVVPITNGVFQSNSTSLSFSDNGMLLSGEYSEDTSRAVVASATLSKVADTALQGIKDIQAAGPAAQLAKVKANTDLLTALKGQQDAQKALNPAPTESTDTEKALVDSNTALINARKANLEARLALEAAKATAAKQ